MNSQFIKPCLRYLPTIELLLKVGFNSHNPDCNYEMNMQKSLK